jgi:hypothetical protein
MNDFHFVESHFKRSLVLMKAILSFGLQAVMLSACNSTNLTSTQTGNANSDANKSSATSSPTPGSAQQGANDAIRQVDFMNRTYRGAEATVQVRNGRWESAEDNSYVNVDRVIYGDLTGDGREEAVVTIGESEGGSGYFTRGEIYTLRDGQVVMVAEVEGGDRGSGGIHNIRIEGGQLIVERLEGAANNPEQIETTIYRLNGNNLVQVGEVRRRPFSESSAQQQTDSPQRIQFESGSDTASVSGTVRGGTEVAYLLSVRSGQRFNIRFTRNSNCDGDLTDPDNERVPESFDYPFNTSLSGRFRKTGDYRIIVLAGLDQECRYTLTVSVL